MRRMKDATAAVGAILLIAGSQAIAQEEEVGISTGFWNGLALRRRPGGNLGTKGRPPGDVFRAVQDLVAEISILRDELGVSDYPPQAELQDDRSPVHV